MQGTGKVPLGRLNHGLYLQRLVPNQELAQRPAWQEQLLCVLCSPKQSRDIAAQELFIACARFATKSRNYWKGRDSVVIRHIPKMYRHLLHKLNTMSQQIPMSREVLWQCFIKILEAIINSEEKNLEKAPKGRRKCKRCCHDIFNSNIKVCKKL